MPGAVLSPVACVILLLPVILVSMAANSMPGGFTSLDPKSPDVQALAQTAMTTINQQSNDAYQLVPISVISAKSQVVAGTNTQLEILVGRSSCLKSQATLSGGDACTATDGSNQNQKIYTVSIWEKPWENFTQVTINSQKDA